MQNYRKPTPSKPTRSRQIRSLAATAAISTLIQASSKPSAPIQELNGRPRTRTQTRKRTNEDEDEHSQKRLRIDPPSALAAPRELVDISQTLENKQRRDPQFSSIPAATSLDLASVSKTRGNKRLPDNDEDEPSNKQRQQSDTGSCLSEENLRKLQSQLKQSQEMEPAVTPADRVRKRDAVTRQPSISDLNPETATASVRSQKSAASLKFYRYNVLERARVYIHCEYPPPEIQVLLDAIFAREIPKERKLEISCIARETAQKLSSETRGAYREDDLIAPLNIAPDQTPPKEMLKCPRKARMLRFHNSSVYSIVC